MSDDFLSDLEVVSSSVEDFPFITEDLRCSACGEQLDIELMHSYDFSCLPALEDSLITKSLRAKHENYQVERSGVQPGTEHGPAVYWNEGTIACPGCGVRLDYSEQSD